MHYLRNILKFAVVLSALCVLIVQIISAGDLEIRLVITDKERLDVLVGDQLFTSYRYESRLYKPIFYPLYSPSGIRVTRAYPIEEGVPGERHDHPHHESVWFTYGNVNGVDFWAKKSVDQGGGRIRHTGVPRVQSGKTGELETAADWILPDRKVILKQKSRVFFRAAPHWRLMDISFTLTAHGRKVVFADTEEGGFGIRVATDLHEVSGTGAYIDAFGREKEKGVWGKRSPWAALRGELQGEDLTLAIFNHPDSTGFPTYWHARGYGLFAANPFGRKNYEKGAEPLNFELQPGESAVFRYLVLIHSGRMAPEELGKWFQNWINSFRN